MSLISSSSSSSDGSGYNRPPTFVRNQSLDQQILSNVGLKNIPETVPSSSVPPFRSQRSQSGLLATEDSDHEVISQHEISQRISSNSRQSSIDSNAQSTDEYRHLESIKRDMKFPNGRRTSRDSLENAQIHTAQLNTPSLPRPRPRIVDHPSSQRRSSQEIPENPVHNPELPPLPLRVNDESHANITSMSYTTQREDYSYVVTQHFDQHGRPVNIPNTG